MVGFSVPVVVIVRTAAAFIAVAFDVEGEAANLTVGVQGERDFVDAAAFANVAGANVRTCADGVKPGVVAWVGNTPIGRAGWEDTPRRWGRPRCANGWRVTGSRDARRIVGSKKAGGEARDPIVHAVGGQDCNGIQLEDQMVVGPSLLLEPLEELHLHVALE